MPNALNSILIELEEAIQDNVPYEKLIDIFRKMRSPALLDDETLPKFFEIMYQLLYYKEDRELYPEYTTEMNIRACAAENIGRAFIQRSSIPKFVEESGYKNNPSISKIQWDVHKAKQYLNPFLAYLANYPSMGHWDWQLFTKTAPIVQVVFEEGLIKIEQEGKREKGYVSGLKIALELKKLEEKIEDNKILWNDVKDYLMPLLNHSHFMVRAGAAKNIGKFYPYKLKDYSNNLPSFLEMLELMGKKEIERAGVLGPFINGFDGDFAGISSLHKNEEVIKATFDVPNYILDILQKSGREPYIPNGQSLDFYAHEYFEGHPASIKRIIAMGKEELACEAATNMQQKIEGMEEVLETLTHSKDKRIATNAKAHLERYYK